MKHQELFDKIVPTKKPSTEKLIKHYVLFWRREDKWATFDWDAAKNYAAKFQITCGFSPDEAALAEMVTIIGAPSGVDERTEKFLKDMGCKVERLDGRMKEDTAELLRQRVHNNKEFVGGRQPLGYPNSPNPK